MIKDWTRYLSKKMQIQEFLINLQTAARKKCTKLWALFCLIIICFSSLLLSSMILYSILSNKAIKAQKNKSLDIAFW